MQLRLKAERNVEDLGTIIVLIHYTVVSNIGKSWFNVMRQPQRFASEINKALKMKHIGYDKWCTYAKITAGSKIPHTQPITTKACLCYLIVSLHSFVPNPDINHASNDFEIYNFIHDRHDRCSAYVPVELNCQI